MFPSSKINRWVRIRGHDLTPAGGQSSLLSREVRGGSARHTKEPWWSGAVANLTRFILLIPELPMIHQNGLLTEDLLNHASAGAHNSVAQRFLDARMSLADERSGQSTPRCTKKSTWIPTNLDSPMSARQAPQKTILTAEDHACLLRSGLLRLFQVREQRSKPFRSTRHGGEYRRSHLAHSGLNRIAQSSDRLNSLRFENN
jgi:hypothetical protein